MILVYCNLSLQHGLNRWGIDPELRNARRCAFTIQAYEAILLCEVRTL